MKTDRHMRLLGDETRLVLLEACFCFTGEYQPQSGFCLGSDWSGRHFERVASTAVFSKFLPLRPKLYCSKAGYYRANLAVRRTSRPASGAKSLSWLVLRRASTSNRLLAFSARVSSGLRAKGCHSSPALTIV